MTEEQKPIDLFAQVNVPQDPASLTDPSAVQTCPKVTFCLALTRGGTLRAFESCNLHGFWTGERHIKVT